MRIFAAPDYHKLFPAAEDFNRSCTNASEIFICNHHSHSNRSTNAAAWSSDGKKLAFDTDGSLNRGVYVVDIDACLNDPEHCSAQVQGPYWKESTSYITWSPNGRCLAVAPGSEIVLNNIQTKQETILVDARSQPLLMHGLAWSPGGKWIGYAVDKTKSSGYSEINLISPYDRSTISLTEKDILMVVGWLDINH